MKILSSLSVKDLYPLALAEGEGVGTAYEYYVKRALIDHWLRETLKPSSILIAGLPEKYGSSLDFLLIGKELDASLTIVDDRPFAIKKLSQALSDPSINTLLPQHAPHIQLIDNITQLQGNDNKFDLILSSETLQRIPEPNQKPYIQELMRLGKKIAIFTPNGDNADHTKLSGLTGLKLDELQNLLHQAKSEAGSVTFQAGYVDMPPFPPGITRTDEQRQKATSGNMESFVMWGLGYFAKLEKYFPRGWKKSKGHIVYALLDIS